MGADNTLGFPLIGDVIEDLDKLVAVAMKLIWFHENFEFTGKIGSEVVRTHTDPAKTKSIGKPLKNLVFHAATDLNDLAVVAV